MIVQMNPTNNSPTMTAILGIIGRKAKIREARTL